MRPTAAELVRRARTSAHLTQLGLTSPSWETLTRLLAAAGFELRVDLELRAPQRSRLLDDVGRILRLGPAQRLEEVRNVNRFVQPRAESRPAPLDPERLITTLAQHGVRFVLIGALAARLHGFPRVTAVADIKPARDQDNLTRLAAALRQLDARIFTESVPEGLAFDGSPQTLARADLWHLITSGGRLDIAFQADGSPRHSGFKPQIKSRFIPRMKTAPWGLPVQNTNLATSPTTLMPLDRCPAQTG